MFKKFVILTGICLILPNLLTKYYSISISEPLEEYDFIIVGGGTTGSVIANRLSAAGNNKVLVIEAGGEPVFTLSDIPLFIGVHRQTEYDWKYETEPQKHACDTLNNKVMFWPRGKILGGTSNFNTMIFARGNHKDFDNWEELGATGWSYKDVLPYFKKVETMTAKEFENSTTYHGFDGYLKVGVRREHAAADWFVQAGNEIGYKTIDYNGKEDEGFSRIQSTIHKGVRQSSATAYLYSVAYQRKNLHILTNAHVSRVLFNSGSNNLPRAEGVELVRFGKTYKIKARKEVILSGGAIGSPHLLMLSGVGPKEHLESMKINVVADLPGVGSNLQDHALYVARFQSEADVTGEVVTSTSVLTPSNILSYLRTGSAPFGSSTTDGIAFMRTSKDTVGTLPDLFIFFGSLKAGIDDVYFQDNLRNKFNYKNEFVSSLVKRAKDLKLDSLHDFVIVIAPTNPKSSGTIRLRSSNYTEHPIIDPNYLSDPRDVETFIRGFRVLEELEKTPTFKSRGIRMVPLTPECPYEEKTPRSDEYYECLARKHLGTVYHPCCTAKMGRREDKMAVTDSRLRVLKVEGLRVADASVMPKMTSGPLQAPCYMIGEKGSDMILEDWKLK